MDASTENTVVNVLMLPWLAHGHISPFLELAKKLTKRNFRIFLCSTPINLNSVRNRITEEFSQSIQPVELHLPSSPELPPHHHTTNGLPSHLLSSLNNAFESASPSISDLIKTLNPDMVICDGNHPWISDIASSHNIPAVQFLITGASGLSFCMNMFMHGGKKQFPFRVFDGVKIHDKSGNGPGEGIRILRALKSSGNVLLIHSFREIEEKYINFLSDLVGKRVLPTGPLIHESGETETPSEILNWLDKKPKSSVVFVSFGSECLLSKKQMEEVAHGLEQSNVNFIWVVRFPSGEKVNLEEALPEDFLERVGEGERGMIVKGWAPQAKILAHRSTGGFVSQCGWNSTIEGMSFGVPIIAMPMRFEQPFTARMVVDVGFGLEVPRNDGGELQRDEIARVIREVLLEPSGESVIKKARELSESIRVKKGEEMDQVAAELRQLCKKID